MAQDDQEISVGDLFNWFKGDCASAEQEAEKLALIDEILRDDLLPAERPNLHKLKFAILAESPWLDPERAEAALDAFTAGFRECPSALRTFIRPGQLRDLAQRLEGRRRDIDRLIIKREIDIQRALIAEYEESGEIPERYRVDGEDATVLVMLYNGLGAALFQQQERAEGELREAEQALQSAATHAANSAPTFQFIVLCNQLFVWAELGAWDRCGRRLPEFDSLRAECDIAPFKDRDPELFGAVPLADALAVVISFRNDRMDEAWRRLAALIGVDRRRSANHDAEIVLFVPPRDFPTLAFLRRAHETVAEDDIIELPTLSRQKLLSLMVGDEGAWLHAYRRGLQGESAAFQAMIDETSAVLSAGLTPLWRSPAVPKAGQTVRITMSNVLANLPVTLAPIDGTALIERNLVINRPAGTIPATSASDQKASEQSLLIFANPTDDLPHADDEADALTPLFHDAKVLRGDDASAAAFFDVLAKGHPFSHIHFAGHAQFRWSERGEGGLRFAKGALVDDEAIRQRIRLPQGPVVVLSACEAAISDSWGSPYDPESLSRAFLAAGASGVVSALWPVADRSTALLMRRFYELHLGGAHPAAALRGAQLWLRDATAEELADYVAEFGDGDAVRGFGFANLGDAKGAPPSRRPFEHPWHWAGFIYSEA